MRILLIDDHKLFREALLHVLKGFYAEVVVLEAATAQEALQLAAHYTRLDLILLDLAMPGLDGLSALPKLQELAAGVPIVVLSASESPAHVKEALNARAAGYIPKSSSSHEMMTALNLVLTGEVYVPPALMNAVETVEKTQSTQPETLSEVEGLTSRQLEVLGLMAQGLSNKHIARQLDLAEGTVKLHVTAIMRALNTQNRTQAVIEGARRGLLAPAKDPD